MIVLSGVKTFIKKYNKVYIRLYYLINSIFRNSIFFEIINYNNKFSSFQNVQVDKQKSC